jgi:acyl-coenzyme A thioesterase 9
VTNKGAAVNPLVPDSPAAETLFAATAERVAAKKRRLKTLAAGDAGLSEATREAKRRFAADAMARARALLELPALAPPDVVAVDATRCDNTFVAQPQQRNLSGRIFGGFLLRRAFELAFATTYVFGGARPHFKQVSDMNFLRPVDVGDLLRFRARVLNARNPGEEEPAGGDLSTRLDRPCVDVEVEALVTKPEANFAEVSNTFMFKFWVGAAGEGRTVKTPVPKSPEEAAHVWERCVREDADDEGGGRS